jgi:HTH-type transcriptional regulator/antitoxin HigA
LGDVLGSRSRASEVLNRKRALTVDMIFKLNEAWGIPTDCLVRPYALAVA